MTVINSVCEHAQPQAFTPQAKPEGLSSLVSCHFLTLQEVLRWHRAFVQAVALA